MVAEKAELWVSLNIVLRNVESKSCVEHFKVWANGQVFVDVKVRATLGMDFRGQNYFRAVLLI